MSEGEIYGVLTQLFHEAFGDSTIVLRPEMAAGDIEDWDSFKQVEILVAVEQQFGVTLRSKDVDGLKCVGDLVQLLQVKLR